MDNNVLISVSSEELNANITPSTETIRVVEKDFNQLENRPKVTDEDYFTGDFVLEDWLDEQGLATLDDLNNYYSKDELPINLIDISSYTSSNPFHLSDWPTGCFLKTTGSGLIETAQGYKFGFAAGAIGTCGTSGGVKFITAQLGNVIIRVGDSDTTAHIYTTRDEVAASYYNKNETYTKAEVNALLPTPAPQRVQLMSGTVEEDTNVFFFDLQGNYTDIDIVIEGALRYFDIDSNSDVFKSEVDGKWYYVDEPQAECPLENIDSEFKSIGTGATNPNRVAATVTFNLTEEEAGTEDAYGDYFLGGGGNYSIYSNTICWASINIRCAEGFSYARMNTGSNAPDKHYDGVNDKYYYDGSAGTNLNNRKEAYFPNLPYISTITIEGQEGKGKVAAGTTFSIWGKAYEGGNA